MDTDLAKALAGVPCQAEFYRYVQWHNLAFAVTLVDLDVPSMVLYYEDYSTRFNDVTNQLMNFLELEAVGEAPPFVVNKEYGDYYTFEETESIATFIKEFSSKHVWQHLKHYFGEKVALGHIIDVVSSQEDRVGNKVKGVITVV